MVYILSLTNPGRPPTQEQHRDRVHTDVREEAMNKTSRGNFVTGPLILA
jgi:hypothetical protein